MYDLYNCYNSPTIKGFSQLEPPRNHAYFQEDTEISAWWKDSDRSGWLSLQLPARNW